MLVFLNLKNFYNFINTSSDGCWWGFLVFLETIIFRVGVCVWFFVYLFVFRYRVHQPALRIYGSGKFQKMCFMKGLIQWLNQTWRRKATRVETCLAIPFLSRMANARYVPRIKVGDRVFSWYSKVRKQRIHLLSSPKPSFSQHRLKYIFQCNELDMTSSALHC